MKKEELSRLIGMARSIEDVNRLIGTYLEPKHQRARALAIASGAKDIDAYVNATLSHRRYVGVLKSIPNGLASLLRIQNDKCAYCKKRFGERTQPVIDHCHEMGIIRGALHGKCNTQLGLAGDTQRAIKKHLQYLERDVTKLARPDLRHRKVRSLNYEKAERAHLLACLRGIHYRSACELVWASPDNEYPEEVEYFDKVWERLGHRSGLRTELIKSGVNIDKAMP